MQYFKVRLGFGKNDFVSIDETDLSKAMRAQVKGTIVILGGESIAGNTISRISPDYNRIMGWYADYEPTGGDRERLESNSEIKQCRMLLEQQAGILSPQKLPGIKEIAPSTDIWMLNDTEVIDVIAKAYLEAIKSGLEEVVDKSGEIHAVSKIWKIEHNGEVLFERDLPNKVQGLPYKD